MIVALIVALVVLVALLVASLVRPAPADLRAVVRAENQRKLRDPRRLLR